MTLEHLQPNDRVYVEGGRGYKKILTIERVTKTQIITKGGSRWNRQYGYLVGASIWDSAHIYELTPAREATATAYHIAKLTHDTWYDLIKLPFPSHVTLDRLCEIYKELKG